MEIINQRRNEFFKRNEIEAVVESEKNPSFAEMAKLISEKFGKPEENVVVFNILNKFGRHDFKIFALVYDSEEDKKKAEQKTQKQRKAEAEAAKTASATPAA